MHLTLLLLLVTLAPSRVAAEEPSPWPRYFPPLAVTDTLAATCVGIVNSFECARAIEKVQIGRTGARVVRQGDTLRIRVGGRKVVSLRDTGVDTADVVAYSYIEYLPQLKRHLVNVQYFEGDEFVLVEATTGRRTKIAAVPVVSPRATRFVCVDDNSMSRQVLEIWRLTPDGLRRELFLYPEEWTPVSARWIDETTIQVAIEEMADEAASRGKVLHLRHGKWFVADRRPEQDAEH